ncbi:MAG: HEAT repeat domain-containing protein [Sedimentisphaerales bacterium]|nr:HEAT repeat domain-containing protein [Sedimentisphaerales bacterium]
MFKGRTIALVLAFFVFSVGISFAQSLEDNWADFLHYTKIGRIDLAKGYAQAVLDSEPDALELLALSEGNPQGYELLLKVRVKAADDELAELSAEILDIIEQGRFMRRTDPKIISEEIRRLSGTARGQIAAVKRLKNAGEYAIVYMIDAMMDKTRREELSNIVWALPQVGKDAIRPLAASLQIEDAAMRTEVARALGKIGYPHALPYLKYIAENDSSSAVRQAAEKSITQIDPASLRLPAAELFFQLAEKYYYHLESLAPAEDAAFGNIWFWDAQGNRLVREKIDRQYFNELMAMRCCEWSLKADAAFGKSIGLWLAAFCKTESTGLDMPNYFGDGHADAITYATTAGPEYLHQALARGIKDKNSDVALCAVEALATTAGEKSLLYRIGISQPLVQALTYDDRAVRYSAAIAIAAAGPQIDFPEKKLVMMNLAEILAQDNTAEQSDRWNAELANNYAFRAAGVMLKLAQTRNRVIDLSDAQDTLIDATKDERQGIQVLAGQILARLDSPNAQRAVAAMALSEKNDAEVRILAFGALSISAKQNGSLLDDDKINAIYSLVGSAEADPTLRAAAAAAYGALNLPSQKVKDLILDQSQS